MRAGVEVALLSGRASAANRVRAAELGITELKEGVKVKLPVFLELLQARGPQPEQAAYMGDDLIDLPPMAAAGLALAPADAVAEARAAAHWVARRPGGRGAVRLACELILRAQGSWEQVTARYHQS
jgi:3-deoxy-D-manno-octulosonate 8-phosphate phosphatase (KDO 8-P phosphatase)